MTLSASIRPAPGLLFRPPPRSFLAWALAFSLVATISGIHHVNERVDRAQWPIYDAGFIIWGAAMLLAGFLLLRGSRREMAPQEV